MTKGFFVTFEGGEGVGKSTQIKNLGQNLKSQGHDVVITREPGGCPVAEDIRNLIFDKKYAENWSIEAETLLMYAARSMHIKEIIAPALSAGKIVLCDRYMDSTRVYQGFVKKIDLGFIQTLEEKIVGQYVPDLTFILDLKANEAMARVKGRGAENHHDRGSEAFYEGLRQGFLKIAKDDKTRCAIVDASQEIDFITGEIFKIAQEKINKKK